MSRTKKKGHDGWIAALVAYAAEKWHWSYGEILWETPASAICLLKRSEALAAGKIYPLSEIEKIDDGEEADS